MSNVMHELGACITRSHNYDAGRGARCERSTRTLTRRVATSTTFVAQKFRNRSARRAHDLVDATEDGVVARVEHFDAHAIAELEERRYRGP